MRKNIGKQINPIAGEPRGNGRFKPGVSGNPAGAAKVPIDLAAIEGAASIGCTREEIATVAGVAPSTLYARMAAEPEIQEAIDRGAARGRATLRRLQWQGASNHNPAMLIWLGKQMLGQKDKHEQPEQTPADQSALTQAQRIRAMLREIEDKTNGAADIAMESAKAAPDTAPILDEPA